MILLSPISKSISIIALALAIIATVSSIYFSQLGLKTNVLPTLFFVYDSTQGWSIKNVGNGPALNVVVAHQNHDSQNWIKPTRLYPLPQDDSVFVRWVGHNPDKLMASYTDVHNRPYTSVTDEDLTTIKDKNISQPWRDSDVQRIWERQ